MVTKRMLVDASHPEETRIVVTSGNRLDEFDFESASRRQLRGNIYLAKVTRVEPSLQAAFIEYGGNRHGFLAFSEIHPDYYQIPVADREALLRAEAEANAVSEEVEPQSNKQAEETTPPSTDEESSPEAETEAQSDLTQVATMDGSADIQNPEAQTDADEQTGEAEASDTNFEEVGGGEDEELPEQRRKLTRRYKIQEVIKRRQVLLVQVVKEERGNKGAALTTYLSLAGRYSVLMPNTARGGGISRKITNSADRKRLKTIASDLEVPSGMGVILRTAGASRTKAEIKRDFEYLSRLWENVRQLTMKSAAPSLVYEEGSLIKRTIRDLYNKDIGEVLVAGDAAYREAKDFMRLIMPSHAKAVQAYKEDQHLFTRFNVETQLDSMFSPKVTLPSGGYLVINPTEALVSVDVNSGRATKEHNIEDTAQQTNLEAADEVARQLRLRDLAGLIVIDFIDMTERRSIRNVEKRMKDALKNDRARIQVGRISHFGLLEMSRQRMRFGVLESSTHACPNCEGTGIVRAVESSALMVMRAIEDHVVRRAGQSVEVRTTPAVALYILNAKRALLTDLEGRLDLIITITADNAMSGSQFSIDRSAMRPAQNSVPSPVVSMENTQIDDEEPSEEPSEEPASEQSKNERPQRQRRRRRSGGTRGDIASEAQNLSKEEPAETQKIAVSGEEKSLDGDPDDPTRKRRRRGRRGGRRNRRTPQSATEMAQSSSENETSSTVVTPDPALQEQPVLEPASTPTTSDQPQSVETPKSDVSAPENSETSEPAAKPAKRRRPRKSSTPKTQGENQNSAPTGANETAPSPADVAPAPTKAQEQSTSQKNGDTNGDARPARESKNLPEEGVIIASSSEDKAQKPKRKGWWSAK